MWLYEFDLIVKFNNSIYIFKDKQIQGKVVIALAVAAAGHLWFGFFCVFFFLNCFSFKRQKFRWVTEIFYIVRNGYVADENQCRSIETKGAVQAQKNQTESKFGLLFLWLFEMGFHRQLSFPSLFFNSPHQFTDGWQTCKIIKPYFLLNKYGYNNGIHCGFTTECLSLIAWTSQQWTPLHITLLRAFLILVVLKTVT